MTRSPKGWKVMWLQLETELVGVRGEKVEGLSLGEAAKTMLSGTLIIQISKIVSHLTQLAWFPFLFHVTLLCLTESFN